MLNRCCSPKIRSGTTPAWGPMSLSAVTWNGPGLVGSAVGHAWPTQPVGETPGAPAAPGSPLGSAAPPGSGSGITRSVTCWPSPGVPTGVTPSMTGAFSSLEPSAAGACAGALGAGADIETSGDACVVDAGSSLEQPLRATGSAAPTRW